MQAEKRPVFVGMLVVAVVLFLVACMGWNAFLAMIALANDTFAQRHGIEGVITLLAVLLANIGCLIAVAAAGVRALDSRLSTQFKRLAWGIVFVCFVLDYALVRWLRFGI